MSIKGRMLLPGGYLEDKYNARPFRGQTDLNAIGDGTLEVSAG